MQAQHWTQYCMNMYGQLAQNVDLSGSYTDYLFGLTKNYEGILNTDKTPFLAFQFAS